MEIPRRPPTRDELWKKVALNEIPFMDAVARVAEPTVSGKYLHWDKLRHRTPPDGLDHQGWWFGLKIHRMGLAKRIPLSDVAGRNFTFNLVDPLPECLHHIDSLSRGVVQVPEPVTNPETRNRYIIRSLIEESITSSQLEGASTTREVAKEMLRQGRRPRDRSEQMIMNNYLTMQSVLKLKGELLSKELVFRIHRMVTEGTLDEPTGTGRFRRPEEEIVVGDDYGEIFHAPPPAIQLDGRMAAMCDFANGVTPSGFVHPVVRSIILHFWLAYDHPFIDGNGRTARALFYWCMLKNGYWLFEYVTISKIILKGPARYGRAFLYTETDDNDLTYFLLYHADVIKRAIDELHEYIEHRTEVLRRAETELRGLTSLNHRQREVISHAIRHPGFRYYTVESHRNSHNVVYETARSDLMDLAERHLLIKHKQGKTWHFSPAPDLEARLRSS